MDPPPVDTGTGEVSVYLSGDSDDVEFLQGDGSTPEQRFSVYSLPYYLIGVLDSDVDGKDGLGFREPTREGTFRSAGGRLFDPKFDVAEDSDRLVEVDREEGRFELRDRNGVSYRYYRWLPDASSTGQNVTDLRNVPTLLGDPADDIALRDAEYAIVAAGPNRVFGEEATESEQTLRAELGGGAVLEELERVGREDNVVEVGR